MIVPTEVPIAVETKQLITNTPTTANSAGIIDKPNCTVLSTPPIELTAPENIPAQRKMRIIVMIFFSPTPFVKVSSFSPNDLFLFWIIATASATKKHKSADIT